MKSNKLVLMSVLALSVLAVSACENTWKGAGKDMKQTGAAIDGSADGDNYENN